MLSPITSPVCYSSPMSVNEDESVCEVVSTHFDHSYSQPENVVSCLSCCDKKELIKSLCKKVASMSLEMMRSKTQTRNIQDSEHHFLVEIN